MHRRYDRWMVTLLISVSVLSCRAEGTRESKANQHDETKAVDHIDILYRWSETGYEFDDRIFARETGLKRQVHSRGEVGPVSDLKAKGSDGLGNLAAFLFSEMSKIAISDELPKSDQRDGGPIGRFTIRYVRGGVVFETTIHANGAAMYALLHSSHDLSDFLASLSGDQGKENRFPVEFKGPQQSF